MNRPTRAGTLPLLGGWLCLDFANTLVWRLRADPEEWLDRFDELAAWAYHAGILSLEQERALRRHAAVNSAPATAALERAVALREAIYRVFVALMGEREPTASDLQYINAVLTTGMARATVAPTTGGYVWGWAPDDDSLERPLWAVARSAAELLVSPERQYVRQCPGDGCGWLFLDTSRNRSRRWCNMAVCGNRARVRAHYRRTREAARLGDGEIVGSAHPNVS